MNKTDSSIESFINNYHELKNSSQDLFDNKSFHQDLARKNIDFIQEGRYAIVDDIWKIDNGKNNDFISGFINLAEQSAEEYKNDIDKIKDMMSQNESFAKEFLLNVLTNKHKIIANLAKENDISMDFLTFLAIFIAFPYRESVSQFIQQEINLTDHVSAFCPVCGHWPELSYIVGKEGKRIMACVCCNTHWLYRRVKCNFCLNAKKDTLGYLEVEGSNEITAYTCDHCRRYIKTKKLDIMEPLTEWPIADYILSGFVDLAALQNKYIRESILCSRFESPKDKNIESYITN